MGVGSGGIRTHNLLGDVRTSRLARLSVHTTEPLAQRKSQQGKGDNDYPLYGHMLGHVLGQCVTCNV